jgi:LytS/YehU family sensor histidine kinase
MSAYLILLGWSLLYFSWSYIENNRSRIIERLQMQNDMQELELKSMRSNLQPHFIFNSLNSIRALVNEDPDAARLAVTKLSKILRTSISTKENSITLDDELKLVEDYLHLEKIRFEERLQYELQIAAKTRPCLIPPMLIQNMVENAVKHGISLLETGGTIWIKSQIEPDNIRISIKNEGQINEENKLEGTGFGMSSSQKRLNHLYPEAPPIIMKEENGMVIVEICIPNNIKPYEN